MSERPLTVLRSWKYKPVPRSKIVAKADRGKLRQNSVGAGERRNSSGACKHWFQYLISVYQLLVTLWLVNFDSFTSTLTLHTWLQTNMVSVCNLPSPHILTFWYEEVGGLRYLKRISQVLCLSSRCFSLARFFATRPFSSLACTDREHGTG